MPIIIYIMRFIVSRPFNTNLCPKNKPRTVFQFVTYSHRGNSILLYIPVYNDCGMLTVMMWPLTFIKPSNYSQNISESCGVCLPRNIFMSVHLNGLQNLHSMTHVINSELHPYWVFSMYHFYGSSYSINHLRTIALV